MYRDFSTKSKQNLLNLVSQVENEKWSDFTDWVGDRWLDFQSWIGKLNIRNYINNVNEYHKNVIDKNNTTKKQIETIFADISLKDTYFMIRFSSIRSSLQSLLSYLNQMAYIVSPQNGSFNAQYINDSLSRSWSDIALVDFEDNTLDEKKMFSKALKVESGIFKALSKHWNSELLKKRKKNDESKSNDTGLISSSLSYISGLYTFYSSDYKSPSELANGSLKFAKSSASMWSGLYKYYEKKLNISSPLEASRLGKKFQKSAGVVSLVGDICGFSAEAINTFNVFMDEDAETCEKIEQSLKGISSGLDIADSAFALRWNQKELTRTFTSYQWSTSAANSNKFKTASAVSAVLGVIVDTLSGSAARYGKVTADGTFDMGDIGEVVVAGPVRGLTSIVSFFTLGISDALGLSDHAEDITDGILSLANERGVDYVYSHKISSEYIQNTQWMHEYANDERNNVFARIGVSVVAGTGMIGALAVDKATDLCSFVVNRLIH